MSTSSNLLARPPVFEPQIMFCGTVNSVKKAMTNLSSSQFIFMDCEGVELGVVGGALSILSLGVIPRGSPNTLKIYLIDATNLSVSRLRPLFDLLASPKVIKVVWDGRMDYSALYHEYGVQMRNVIDLQVADILSRVSRDTPAQHLQRFKGYVQANLLDKADVKKRYQKLHRISSLYQATQEHKPAGYQQFRKAQVDHNIWGTARPLPADHVRYAAMDIEMIAALYLKFHALGYISPPKILSITSKSARYIGFWTDRQPTTAMRGNYFFGNAFLPLELIDDIPLTQGKHKCGKCQRSLTDASFSSGQLKSGRKPTNNQLKCLVCAAVVENTRHWALRDRAMARRKAEAAAKASAAPRH
ncbi:ribonuclease H-like domain-containing protein [Irpex lacteus]|nr:ribonuclease H-like domain-containing protein [Irpex lacteus]